MPEFVRVASASEVPPGEMKIVEVNDQEVVIANIDGEFVCFSNSCTHRQGPLGEGMLLPGGVVECPFHGGQFNVRTGEVVAPPPEEPITTYPVEVDGDEISVAV
ncbi:MAG: non-heme iron oxygenase ferredoxin subunit [Dehalococcoidia bacterium]